MTGWCVLEVMAASPAKAFKVLDYGCIETTGAERSFERILKMAESFEEVVARYSPGILAVEELFFLKKSKTLFQIAQARGAIVYLAAKSGMKIYEYNPKDVKKSLTGYGAADKFQIQNAIKNTLGLKDIPRPDDVADAIAIALCHYYSHERFKDIPLL